MPKLNKQNLEGYIHSGCQRQFILDLATKNERELKQLPLGFIEDATNKVSKAGENWESDIYSFLRDKFAFNKIYENYSWETNKNTYVSLLKILETNPQKGSFIFQGQISIDENVFKTNIGILENISISLIQPDIIMILDSEDDYLPNTEIGYVLPNGDVVPFKKGDKRKRLRVIDIKLSPEPKARHFVEIAFYCLILAMFLKENNLDEKYVVSSDSCLLTNNKNGLFLNLDQTTESELENYKSFNKDLHSTKLTLFLDKIKKIIISELPVILNQEWQDVDWSINQKCLGCKYLGKTGKEVDKNDSSIDLFSCKRESIQKLSLDMIYGFTIGELNIFKRNNIKNIEDFLSLNDEKYEIICYQNNKLLLKKDVLMERAKSLYEYHKTNVEKSFLSIPEEMTTSLIKWNDLSVYITGSFDGSTGDPLLLSITSQIRNLNNNEGEKSYLSKEFNFLFENNKEEYQYNIFVSFIEGLYDIFNNEDISIYQNDNKKLRFSIYFWDKGTYNNIILLFEKYGSKALEVYPFLKDVFWLFASVDAPIVNNKHDYNHIIIIKDIIDKYLIAPIPYYYSLHNVSRLFNFEYKNTNYVEPKFYNRFYDPMNDEVPIERAYELWVTEDSNDKKDLNKEKLIRSLEEFNSHSNFSLKQIVMRLRDELKDYLSDEQSVFEKSDENNILHSDANYLLSFHKMQSVLEKNALKDLKKLPINEKIIKQKTALLSYRVSNDELYNFSTKNNFDIIENMVVYKLSNSSVNFTGKEQESNWAMIPREYSGKSLIPIGKLFNNYQNENYKGFENKKTLEDILSVKIEFIDRDEGYIVLTLSDLFNKNSVLSKLLDDISIDLNSEFILENKSIEVFNNKLNQILVKMGHSENSKINPILLMEDIEEIHKDENVFHKFLWNPQVLADEKINIDVNKFISIIEKKNYTINSSQKEAIIKSLTSHLHLIWGPPGTGKSFTLVIIILIALMEAKFSGRKLRVLISSFTWTAIDNILKDLKKILPEFFKEEYMMSRVRSSMGRPSNIESLRDHDVVLQRRSPSTEVKILKEALLDKNPYKPTEVGLYIVGTTVHQLSNLLLMNTKDNIDGLFDLIIIDEASQMPVSHALCCSASLNKNGSIIIAGDHLQLAPVQSVKPKNQIKKYLVGSVYNFLFEYHNIKQTQLNVNYRSNQSIVDFCKLSGYQPDLRSYNPLQLVTLNKDYSSSLYKDFLNPENSLITYIHKDEISNQSSEFEANLVANLVYEFFDYMKSNTKSKKDIDSFNKIFWEELIGIVTPHRAQQSLIVNKLINMFPNQNKDNIRNSVDTVERFQGQQRDVIIGSFALGDKDIISGEEEFLYSLNRFNVMVSRARMKMILITSENIVNYIPSELEVLKHSNLLKSYVNNVCENYKILDLPYSVKGNQIKFHRNQDLLKSYQFQKVTNKFKKDIIPLKAKNIDDTKVPSGLSSFSEEDFEF
jgi:DNA replication ATP-dependent helicase Dna2